MAMFNFFNHAKECPATQEIKMEIQRYEKKILDAIDKNDNTVPDLAKAMLEELAKHKVAK